jgi:S-adenosylmethionine:tRNA ribosyltransferase-isomerase
MISPELLSDYDFHLPEGQIAQSPAEPRDASRLLALDAPSGTSRHLGFKDVVGLLSPGDLLVVNDARVIPARLLGRKVDTGGRAELLLVRTVRSVPMDQVFAAPPDAEEWVCLGQASKGLKPGQRVELAGGSVARVEASLGEGEYRVRFEALGSSSLAEVVEAAGKLPLPPYIEREPTAADAERYQTVYARAQGSVAAPTAGLHFTPALFAALQAKGVERASVTLHVGPGTFLPVRDDDVSRHRMHAERFEVPRATVEAVRRARSEGRRVVAVGTTVVRTLESATDPSTLALREGPGETALFIRAGYGFRQVDALVTNFHLPRSTLLMLVCAFGGKDRVLGAYREAVSQGYRFFSYGDAMFLGRNTATPGARPGSGAQQA